MNDDDRAERDGRDGARGTGHARDGTLVFLCHLVAALVLVAPVVAAGITRNLTVLAVGGVAALVIVRVLIVNVVPWLERRGHREDGRSGDFDR